MWTSHHIVETLERVMRSPGWAYTPWRFMPPYRPFRAPRRTTAAAARDELS
jgi:hypothetical protein